MSRNKSVEQEPPVEETSLATQPSGGELSTEMSSMFAEHAGEGNDFGANDLAIPYLSILQKSSPQVSRANPKFIKGAEVGMIMNTLTQRLFPGETGISVIPCGYMKLAVRWKPRDSGGGFVCNYIPGDVSYRNWPTNSKGQPEDPVSKDIIMDTAHHYVIQLIDGESPEFAVVSMSSTNLKTSRTWNTIMKKIMMRGPSGMFNPPSFSHQYRLTTVPNSKNQYDWFTFGVETEGAIKDPTLFKMAQEFATQIRGGLVRVASPTPDEVSEAGSGPDEVPF